MVTAVKDVNSVRLDYHEAEMLELKQAIEKLNDTIAGMTRTFISAQVCENRVAKIEGEQSDLEKAVMKLVATVEAQQAAIGQLGELVKSHEVTVSEVKRLKQMLIGGIGLSALVNPTAQGILAKMLQSLSGP